MEELPQSRHQHHHADKAVNHGGDTRQHGDRLLHKAFDGLRRHFCQIHRRQESDRHADDDGSGGSVDAGENEGENAVFRLRRRGRPFLAEQEMETSPICRMAGMPEMIKYMVIRSTQPTVISPRIRKIPWTTASKMFDLCFMLSAFREGLPFCRIEKLAPPCGGAVARLLSRWREPHRKR